MANIQSQEPRIPLPHVNWRSFLTQLRVQFRDRGPNCSSGHINIACPWCGNDPSMHLRINESNGKYFCLRDPRHGGSSAGWLIAALSRAKGLSPKDTIALVADHRSVRVTYERSYQNFVERDWGMFFSAAESDECLDYLESRGFEHPMHICQIFDLRYARVGQWARRLLFPLRDTDGVVGAWTGRAMRTHDDMRYFTLPYNAKEKALFFGDFFGPTLILVEGPMDAAKINAAAVPGMTALAMTTSSLDDTRAAAIMQLRPHQVLVCPDSTAPLGPGWRTASLLAWLTRPVRFLRLPTGVKDAGEMSESQIRKWLGGYNASTGVERQPLRGVGAEVSAQQRMAGSQLGR